MSDIHTLYRQALAADEAWQAELVRLHKGNAGDVRYTPAGRMGGLERLHAEFERATCEWRNHPECAATKGCDCSVDHGFRPRARYEPSLVPMR